MKGTSLHLLADRRAELNGKGWTHFDTTYFEEDKISKVVYELVCSLGNPVASRGSQIIQALSPVESNAANRSSLSNKFGTGEFPLHSDTAHWITPARYVVLACVQEGDNPAPTRVLDTYNGLFDSNEKDILRDSVFYVKNGRNSFYGSILSPFRPFIRYDPGCMIPINDKASTISDILNKKDWKAMEFHWKSGLVLILDNWRTLHGRGASPISTRNRKLLRGLAA